MRGYRFNVLNIASLTRDDHHARPLPDNLTPAVQYNDTPNKGDIVDFCQLVEGGYGSAEAKKSPLLRAKRFWGDWSVSNA